MNEELMPAITLLERKVAEAERKANSLLGALNVLRAEAGLAPRPPGGGGGGPGENAATPSEIRPDTFFGKKQQTAIREFLQMRRALGNGPAKPREIYDALLTGGYQFEAKDTDTALIGLRALLRKRTNIFMKLPNGAYGLTLWYPEAKKQKAAIPESGADAETDTDEADLDDEDQEVEAADADATSAA